MSSENRNQSRERGNHGRNNVALKDITFEGFVKTSECVSEKDDRRVCLHHPHTETKPKAKKSPRHLAKIFKPSG